MDWPGSSVYRASQTVPIFCFHFLTHKKKKGEKDFLFSHVGVLVRILLSRTVNRSRRRGKTQEIENPAQESKCNKDHVEL